MISENGYFEDSTVQATLQYWRSRAVTVLLAVIAVAYLPGITMIISGRTPPGLTALKTVMLLGYAIILCLTVGYRIDYRFRAITSVFIGYVIAVTGAALFPSGLFVRHIPVTLPMLTLVLLGAWPGRIAAAISVAVILVIPQVFMATGHVPETLNMTKTELQDMRKAVLYQGVALAGQLIVLVALLDRFHHFLVSSLHRLEKETSRRRKAYNALEKASFERQRLEMEAERAGDEERRRLGLEIHDGVCQQLTGALLRSEALTRRLERNETPAISEIKALSLVLKESIDEVRAVAKGLYALDDSPDALVSALHALVESTAKTTQLQCRFQTDGDVNISNPSAVQHLYRIAQEAISNAVRHARAGRILVSLQREANELILEVKDDGKGFLKKGSMDGMGLRTMTYRAGLLGGDISVKSEIAEGTCVCCRIPYDALVSSAGPPEEEIHD